MKRRVRRARTDPPVVQERWRPGLLHLVGIAILLSLAAAFMRSNRGDALGLLGAFVWVTALVIAFGLGLAHRAPYVLPPEAEVESGQGWREGLRMIAYHFTIMMLPPGLRSRYHRPRKDVPLQLSDSFAEFDAGFVPSHLALILGKGSGYGRAAGPGYVRLRRGERISHVIDLRRQVRREQVEAFTRDGIRLDTSIAITYRVSELQDGAPADLPFPYNPNVVYRLTFSDGVSADSEIPWSEHICPQAAALLVAEIARHRLDQFYRLGSLDPDDAVTLNDLVTEVTRNLNRQLERLFDCSGEQECPVEIHSVSVSHLQPPKEVVEQRIRNWQSGWERRKLLDKAESAAYEIHHLQRVRGDTLRKLILDVTYNVTEMANGDREAISKVLLVRMAEMMDRLIGDRRVKLETPQEVFEAVNKASNLIKSSSGETQS